MLKISAIDVGSNAMRMVVGEVDEAWRVNTIENIRLPVRLGQDVFSNGYLEEKTIQQTEEAFLRFKHVAESFNIHRLRAVATSAAREAQIAISCLTGFFGPVGLKSKSSMGMKRHASSIRR